MWAADRRLGGVHVAEVLAQRHLEVELFATDLTDFALLAMCLHVLVEVARVRVVLPAGRADIHRISRSIHRCMLGELLEHLVAITTTASVAF